MKDQISAGGIRVWGIAPQSQGCVHYRSSKDVIAIRMKCCGRFYACVECHNQLESHPAEPYFATEFETRAVLCRKCGALLTIRKYLNCNFRCPACGAEFNPGCQKHYHYYFQLEEPSAAVPCGKNDSERVKSAKRSRKRKRKEK